MKAITSLAVATFAFAGAACSQATDTEITADMSGTVEAQTVSTEDETRGAINLALPSTTATPETTSGFNLNLGGGTQRDGLLIGGGGLVDTNLGGDSEFVLDLGIVPDAAPAEDDGIIRLEKK